MNNKDDKYMPTSEKLGADNSIIVRARNTSGEVSRPWSWKHIVKVVPLRILALLLILISVISCQATEVGQLTPTPTPAPTPTPQSVEETYHVLEQENSNNSNRLRIREDERQMFRFRGNITKIGDKKIRFYIVPPRELANDLYVECNFDSRERIAHLNVGEKVSVRGELARAFRGRLWGVGEKQAVVFERCEIET